MGPDGSLWAPMDTYGLLWTPMDPYRSLRSPKIGNCPFSQRKRNFQISLKVPHPVAAPPAAEGPRCCPRPRRLPQRLRPRLRRAARGPDGVFRVSPGKQSRIGAHSFFPRPQRRRPLGSTAGGSPHPENQAKSRIDARVPRLRGGAAPLGLRKRNNNIFFRPDFPQKS